MHYLLLGIVVGHWGQRALLQTGTKMLKIIHTEECANSVDGLHNNSFKMLEMGCN